MTPAPTLLGSAALCALLLAVDPAAAEVIQAASCSSADVQSAIDQAVDGDIVSIPAGTCSWTENVAIGEVVDWGPPVTIASKELTVQGAGIDQTVLVNELPRDDGGVDDSPFTILSLEGKPLRVTGLTIRGGAEDTGESDHGAIRLGGSCKSWRVDHVKFDHLRTRAIRTSGHTYGVIDHCEFTTDNWAQFVYVDHGGWGGQSWGDGSWSSPLSLGTEQAVYLEDNVFEWDGGDTPIGALDCGSGGRLVFRNNQIINTSIGNHGTESTGRGRSCFSYEIYDNLFERPVTPSRWTLFLNRGGTGVMFDNTATGNYDSLAHAANYRDYHPFDPWGACDGTSPWDVNDAATHDSGTHSGADGDAVLTSAGAGWTADQWVGYSVHNLAREQSGIITTNTTDTLSVIADQYADPLTWNAGDAFEILNATPCLDQVGRSTGDSLSGDPPTPQGWPNQSEEPFYEWGNTINGDDVDTVADTPHVVEGRDFINDTPRPGYTPYTYPHPLVGSDVGSTCASRGGTCCTANQFCEGGVYQDSAECGTQCCLAGTCMDVPAGNAPPADDDEGCGCRVAGGSSTGSAARWLLGLLGAWLVGGRRRMTGAAGSRS